MKLTLKPATAGLVVRDPQTGEALPAEGKPVVIDTYWRRRMRDQSVIQVTATKKPKTEKKDT